MECKVIPDVLDERGNPMEKVDLFGLKFNAWSLSEAVEHLSETSRAKEQKLVFTPNVDHLVLLEENDQFKKTYDEADVILADGMPIVWFSQLIGRPLPERVTGADLVPGLCEASARKKLKVFLMGGDAAVTPEAGRKLRERFPDLKIAGIETPPRGFEKNENLNSRVLKAINEASPDILFVAMGAPRQELWACRHKKDLNVGVIIGVGGAFDFLAGRISRAPRYIQSAGFEWLWRLGCEPKRLWKRYLVRDLAFLKIAVREWRKKTMISTN